MPLGPLTAKFTVKNGKVVVPKVKKLKVKSLSLPAGPLHHFATEPTFTQYEPYEN